jgi:SPP1 family predicted phage head-tail adaptor
MSQRRVSRRRLHKESIGDMRDRVRIEKRTTQPPEYNSPEFTESYTLVDEVWAKVSTIGYTIGVKDYNEINIEERPTHKISIRYHAGINSEDHVIRFNSDLYDIKSVTNPEERNEYLVFHCRRLGLGSVGANQ